MSFSSYFRLHIPFFNSILFLAMALIVHAWYPNFRQSDFPNGWLCPPIQWLVIVPFLCLNNKKYKTMEAKHIIIKAKIIHMTMLTFKGDQDLKCAQYISIMPMYPRELGNHPREHMIQEHFLSGFWNSYLFNCTT